MKKKVAKASGKITLQVLLEHMQGMKEELKENGARIEGKVDHLGRKFDHLETKVDRLESKIDHDFAQIGGQLDTIDERITDIELIPSVTKQLTRRS